MSGEHTTSPQQRFNKGWTTVPVLDQPHVNTAAAPRTLPASTCNPFSLPGLACSDEPCPAQPGRLLDPFSPNEILQAPPPPPPPGCTGSGMSCWRCGNTKKKAVRNKLAQNEQQRRDIAAEILRIKKGEFDFRRDEEGVANAELRPAQLLSAAADDAKRLVSSGVRELAAGDSAKRACCKSSRCGACSCHSGDDDDEDSDDDDDEASFYSVDKPDLTSACIWL